MFCSHSDSNVHVHFFKWQQTQTQAHCFGHFCIYFEVQSVLLPLKCPLIPHSPNLNKWCESKARKKKKSLTHFVSVKLNRFFVQSPSEFMKEETKRPKEEILITELQVTKRNQINKIEVEAQILLPFFLHWRLYSDRFWSLKTEKSSFLLHPQ